MSRKFFNVFNALVGVSHGCISGQPGQQPGYRGRMPRSTLRCFDVGPVERGDDGPDGGPLVEQWAHDLPRLLGSLLLPPGSPRSPWWPHFGRPLISLDNFHSANPRCDKERDKIPVTRTEPGQTSGLLIRLSPATPRLDCGRLCGLTLTVTSGLAVSFGVAGHNKRTPYPPAPSLEHQGEPLARVEETTAPHPPAFFARTPARAYGGTTARAVAIYPFRNVGQNPVSRPQCHLLVDLERVPRRGATP